MMSTEEKSLDDSLNHPAETAKHQEKPSNPEAKEKPKVLSPVFTAFLEKVSQETDFEQKLKMVIQFMREALTSQATPRFKDFWDAKNACLPFFKEKVNPTVKAELWKQYTELSSEAKRLKDLLDEQSSFAIEQIELALKSLDADIAKHEDMIASLPTMQLPSAIVHFKGHMKFYEDVQRKIFFYTSMASRLKELKDEILKTEMRIRHKNRLLGSLSKLGDHILPKKKELVKQVSLRFNEDIETFGSSYFDLKLGKTKPNAPRYKELKEEVKTLQVLAKQVSLNSQSFNHTRLLLSQCWDIIRNEEKEKKQAFIEKKEQSEKHLESVNEKIEAFRVECQELTSKDEIDARLTALYEAIKALGLSAFDFKTVKAKIQEVEAKILQPFYEKELEQKEKLKAAQHAKKEKLSQYLENMHEVVSKGSKQSLETLVETYQKALHDKKDLKLKENDLLRFERLEKELHELVLVKKLEEAQKGSQAQEELKSLLADWEAFKEATRRRVEECRKVMGNSGFDFEMAMIYREQLDLERARLDRALEKVVELEDLINE